MSGRTSQGRVMWRGTARRAGLTAVVMATATAAAMLPQAGWAQERLPEIQVISNTPLPGSGIDRDKIPSMVSSVTAADFERSYSQNVTDTLFQRIPGVTLSDPNGNSVQQEIRYRGFAASPLQGTPQGLAVYMNGVRLNESFGDTVNWDLIPTNAISRADVFTNNPVFGLNALGGAISLQTKNGFTYQGLEVEGQGGSFGRLQGAMQYGVESGNWSTYIAAQAMTDNGWRQASPAKIGRFYGDVGWRDDRAELHLFGSVASNSFGVAAATPIQMLNRNWSSVYTTPQTTNNDMAMIGLNGKYALTEAWTLQGNVYGRFFRQSHVDGNDADIERCSNSSSFPGQLCLEDDGFPRPSPFTGPAALAFRNQFVILNANNQPIPCPPGPGNTCSPVPYGSIDRTSTDSDTFGGSLQATNEQRLFDHGNRFVVGGSIDRGSTAFGANSTLGYIYPDLSVGLNPAIPGNGQIIHTLGNLGYTPVGIDTKNTYYGLFTTDTFDITEKLAVTGGARYNLAKISVRDVLGTSPDLNSDSTFSRLNPLVGLTYKIVPALSVYGGYSESNRAPTPLELGCSNPSKPCLLESFLVSDPPLDQVVGHTYEFGFRGNSALGGGVLDWKAGLFRTDSDNDIITLASTIQGRGYYQNVPQTRRQGAELSAEYKSSEWLVYAGYSYIDATYRFEGDIASPNNPASDDEGNIHVVSGNRIPGIPQHQFKAGFDYLVTPQWKIGADVVAVGQQHFVGDDANQNDKLPGYAVVNLHTSYQLTSNITVFGVINNLFDNKYALYGTYFEPSGTAKAGLPITLSDQRTEVPGAPFTIYGGIRVKL
ncbi:iron complex outermembrane receptor protein [Rhodopseudomonas rhenobacensis]|uniref:Iron complex outermembrane receptor protein n=1 Tax=Rhodopseudomonas rhenobacensis TaxID=87461 RepID=A0A7W8DXF5_9BRAD|nr:TonB-dependent receptor [Rhodopseudomonas rhenobacensis]MBB5045710.1 iron complex outermembrane receptor protein [Rhodopseudomonas rhenobacensis]